MEKKNQPTFPLSHPDLTNAPEHYWGLTKREYFIGQALIGLLANPEASRIFAEELFSDALTTEAIAIADKLILKLEVVN